MKNFLNYYKRNLLSGRRKELGRFLFSGVFGVLYVSSLMDLVWWRCLSSYPLQSRSLINELLFSIIMKKLLFTKEYLLKENYFLSCYWINIRTWLFLHRRIIYFPYVPFCCVFETCRNCFCVGFWAQYWQYQNLSLLML